MNFLSPILGPNAPLAATFIVAFAVVLVLIGLTAWVFRLLRGRGLGIGSGGRGRQPRLAVLDYADVDARRKLVLIRRDNVEHLLLLGGPTDVVVETAIVRGMPVPANALRDMPAAAAELSAIEPNARKTPRDVAREAAGEPAIPDIEKAAAPPIEAAPLAAPPRVTAPVMPKPEVSIPRPVPPRFEPPKVEAPRVPSPAPRQEPPSIAPPISASPKIEIPQAAIAPEPIIAPRAAPIASAEPINGAPSVPAAALSVESVVAPPMSTPTAPETSSTTAPPKMAVPVVPPVAPRPMPTRSPETRPLGGDDDITSRLEAVLRKPMTPPSLTAQRPLTPPARPSTPPVVATPTPVAPASTAASAGPATTEPTTTSVAASAPPPLSATDKSVFDSLEEEMAALLGRGPTPPKA